RTAWMQSSALPSEQLTQQFYSWEVRGRGWQIWPYAVELEPPFRPFFGHFIPNIAIADDGRRPTFLSSLADGVRNFLSGNTASPDFPAAVPDDLIEEIPEAFYSESDVSEMRIDLPAEFVTRKETTTRFLEALKFCRLPLSFELIGLPAITRVQLVCH